MYRLITIQTHFDSFRLTKADKSICNHNCYNFDKTSFRVRIKQDQRVITKDKSDCLYMKDLENYEYLSSLKCISRGGDRIPNMLI